VHLGLLQQNHPKKIFSRTMYWFISTASKQNERGEEEMSKHKTNAFFFRNQSYISAAHAESSGSNSVPGSADRLGEKKITMRSKKALFEKRVHVYRQTSVNWNVVLCQAAILSLMLCLVKAIPGLGQAPKPKVSPKTSLPSKPATVPNNQAHELTAGDLEAFLDGLVPLQLERDDIAGAAVVVVKDGRILLAKGYGYRDVGKRVPISAQDTLFRPGSVSKLITWTAVMQLVEARRLDLDRDVNNYLDFIVPHTFGKPVTMRNLMTHTPGFEEELKDSEPDTPGDLQSMRPFLLNHLPRQVFAPGTVPAYSNSGATLAGYIVQRVSGQPFEDYVGQHIFRPLDMSRSTFVEPLPKDFEPLMSQGYEVASDEPKPFELLAPAPGPDGTMSTTAIDMAHFMIAHLADGEYEGNRILSAATAELMRTRQFGTDPGLNGMALGFMEENRNGLRVVGHDGDTNYFHSDLHLIPAANVGYFVSYNSTGNGDDPRTALWDGFLDRYFPDSRPTDGTSARVAQDAAVVSGVYLSSRRQQTTILTPLWLLFAESTVSANQDGTIEVDQMKGANGKPKRWRDIGNLIFQEVNGQEKLVFRRDQMGRLEMLSDDPTFIHQQVSWSQNKNVLRVLGISILATFLLTLLLWPVAAIIRRHYGHKLNVSVAERKFRRYAKILSAVNLIFLVSFSAIVASGIGSPALFSDRLDPWLHLLQVLGWIGVVASVAIVYRAWLVWRTSGVGVWTKLYSAGFTLACVGYVWFVLKFHMLRPTLLY
jgi:CubicO group peptidase (beta-lactamase class C family)